MMLLDSTQGDIRLADFFFNYGLFLLKVLTVVVAIVAVLFAAMALGSRGRRGSARGELEITQMNDSLEDMGKALQQMNFSPVALKQSLKEEKAERKAKAKAEKKAAKEAKKKRGDGTTKVEEPKRRTLYVLDFDGDIRGLQVDNLRREISAILTNAQPEDEVVVRLESGGGMVTSYGLGASQLDRLRKKGIPLTVCVDKVAASGGYMMACVADRILAAPFAMLGSIGVVAQIPNFHRLLKQNNVDVELMTAGKFKRTLTMFGENTEEGREKFREDIEDIHVQFKDYVSSHRPRVDIDAVATGETWSGQAAIDNNLIDEICTSDEYLMRACEDSDVYEVKYREKKSIMDRFGMAAQTTLDNVAFRWLERVMKSRYSVG